MNILTGRCDTPRYGECPYCHGNLTNGHDCPQKRAAEEALDSMLSKDPPKLARMIRIWSASTELDQEEIAKAWGTNGATVSRFLNGKHMPDGRTTARIIAWLFEP